MTDLLAPPVGDSQKPSLNYCDASEVIPAQSRRHQKLLKPFPPVQCLAAFVKLHMQVVAHTPVFGFTAVDVCSLCW